MVGIWDKELGDVAVYNAENETHEARAKLVTENVLVMSGGTADFHAGLEVEMKPGFEAVNGSETQIYCANTGPFCELSPSGKKEEGEQRSKKKESEVEQREIVLGYTIKELTRIRVSPNPAVEVLYVQTESTVIDRVEIYDIYGTKVHTTGSEALQQQRTRLNVSALPAGTYGIRVYTPSNIENFKIIIHQK